MRRASQFKVRARLRTSSARTLLFSVIAVAACGNVTKTPILDDGTPTEIITADDIAAAPSLTVVPDLQIGADPAAPTSFGGIAAVAVSRLEVEKLLHVLRSDPSVRSP